MSTKPLGEYSECLPIACHMSHKGCLGEALQACFDL